MMQKIYHITQTTKLLMNGSIIVENSVTQKWAVSFPIERPYTHRGFGRTEARREC